MPIALALALAFEASPTGHALQRTFLSMIPHEVGHAITGWWCGFVSIPGLWKTSVPETRSAVAMIVVAGAIAATGWLGWKRERMVVVGIACALGAAAFFGMTCGTERAHVAVTFGGDGGALAIGTLLVLAFFVDKFRAGGLRWGLLVIGAATYVDVAMTWWHARDHEQIPFGEIEGVGLSDPSRLAEAGWSPTQIVDRYVMLAGVCLAVLVGVWAWQTWAMRRRAT